MSDVLTKEKSPYESPVADIRRSLGLDTTKPAQVKFEDVSVYESPLDDINEWIGLETSPMHQKRKEIPPTESLYSKLATLDDPVAAITQMNAAQYLSEKLNIDPFVTLNNLDAVSKYWLGKIVPPEVLMESMVNAWENGMKDYDISKLYTQLRFSEGGINPEIEQQIADIEAQMVPMAEMPLPWIKQTLLTVAGSGPLMLKSLTEGVKLAVPGAIPALLVPGLAPVIFGMGMVVGSVTEMMDVMAGRSYGELRSKNVPHEVAAPISDIAGIIQGAAEFAGEAIVGFIPGISGIGGIIANRMLLTGTTAKIAIRIAGGMLTSPLGEYVEEGLQTFSDVVAEQVARTLTENSTIEPTTIGEIAKRVGKDAMMGLSAGLIFMVPGLPLGVVSTTTQLNTVKEAAMQTQSRELFVNSFAKDEIAKKASPEAWKEYLGKVWDKQHEAAITPEAKSTEILTRQEAIAQLPETHTQTVEQIYDKGQAVNADQTVILYRETATETISPEETLSTSPEVGATQVKVRVVDLAITNIAEERVDFTVTREVTPIGVAEISEKEITSTEMSDVEIDAVIDQGFDEFISAERPQEFKTEAEIDAWIEEHKTTVEDLSKPFTEVEWNKQALTQALRELGVAGYAKKGYSPIVIGYIRAAMAWGTLTDEQYQKALKYLNQNPSKYKIAIAELRDELTPEILRTMGYEVFTGREDIDRYTQAEAEYEKAVATVRQAKAEGQALAPAYTRELARLKKWVDKEKTERVEEKAEGAAGAPPPPPPGKGPTTQEGAEEAGGLPGKRKPRKKRIKPDVSVAEATEEARKAKPEDFDKKSFKELEDAWEKQKDIWFKEKDEKLHRAKVEHRVLRKQLMSVLGSKRYTDRVRDVAGAIHLYIDTKRNPGHLSQYHDQLTKEQRRLVDLSQNLPVEVYGIVAELEASYEKIGLEAHDADVIHNTHENYVNRVWDLKQGNFSELFRKFGVKTRHSKARVFETIIQGMAQGYSLKITDAIDNLAILKEELIRTIEDKRFLKALTPIRDSEGRPIITARHLENYTKIEHPNFKSYQYAGTVKLDGIAKTLRQIYEERQSVKEVGAKETVTGPIRKLEEVVQFALESKGFTVGEALNAITRLEDAKNGNHAKTIIKEIERAVIEREEITGYQFVPASGKNFFIADDGTILERQEMYSPQSIAKNLNNILGMSKIKDVPGVQFLTKYNALIKAWILQSSFFHHQAFARSYYLGAGRKKTWTEMSLPQAYKAGMKAVEANDPQVISLVRNGLTVGLSQDYDKTWQYERGVLGKMLDKSGAVKAVRDKVIHLRQLQTDWLFGEFGAGLKTMAALIELRQEFKKNPNADPDTTAKNVANLINDDFGGLHLQRMGRNPTLQHIFRLFALAPDWTESNVRTMVKALAPVGLTKKIAEKRGKEYKGISSEESSMYRRFWCRAIIKGLGAVAVANFVLAGGDLDRMKDKYDEAWGTDGNWRRLRWLMIDVTPIYEALGGKGRESKYFNLIGHFRDPFKFILEPVVSAKHKGSVLTGTVLEALSGSDWAGRRFTTMEELVRTGQTVKWEFGGGGAVQPEEFLSFALHEIIGSQPIQVQNFISAMTGELDAFDAVLKSLGVDVRTAYKPKR